MIEAVRVFAKKKRIYPSHMADACLAAGLAAFIEKEAQGGYVGFDYEASDQQ